MTRQTESQSLKSIAGAVLLALGLLLFFANLDAVGVSLMEGIGHRPPEGMEPALAAGLAAIYAVQTYTFEHAQFASGIRQILVSFWPLTLVIVGCLFLRGAFKKFFLALSGQREYPR